ncbi:MAG: [LysW]-aminoadipate kinase [Methanobacteriota archaeon]
MYVVKVGGRDGNDAANVALGLREVRPAVLVHGGSSAVDALATALGHPPRFLTSPSGYVSRYTDAATIDVVSMAMAGRANVALVAALQANGVRAVGLSGVDGRLVVGRRKTAIRSVEGGKVKVVRDDRSGTIESVNADLLLGLLASGYVPVVSPPILDAEDHGPLNVDADRLAAHVAVGLSAKGLVLLTNVPGVCLDASDPSTVVDSIPRADLPRYLETAVGGMRKKLLAALEALDGGVPRVVIGDSRRPDAVRAALRGEGTVIA